MHKEINRDSEILQLQIGDAEVSQMIWIVRKKDLHSNNLTSGIDSYASDIICGGGWVVAV